MNKFIFLFFVVLFITGCSYEPVLTNKEYNFSFSNINFDGEDDINQIVKNKLLKTKNNFGKSYNISYKTRKNKEILSSNEKGDPTVIKIIIILEYSIEAEGKNIFFDKIQKQATYNNINDKFELLKYEENIIKNISENIANQILTSASAITK